MSLIEDEQAIKRRKIEPVKLSFDLTLHKSCEDCEAVWSPNREFTDLCLRCIKTLKKDLSMYQQTVRTLQETKESTKEEGREDSPLRRSSMNGTSPNGSSENVNTLPQTSEKEAEKGRKRPREEPKENGTSCSTPTTEKVEYPNHVIAEIIRRMKIPQLKEPFVQIFWESCNKMDVDKLKEIIQSHPEALSTYDEYGETVLHRAVYLSDSKVLKLLLELGANVHIFNALTGSIPLHRAVVARNAEMVDILLDHNASPNSRDFNGQTPLHAAVLGDCCDLTKKLLEKGARLDTLAFDKTPLELALSSEMKNLLQEYDNKKND